MLALDQPHAPASAAQALAQSLEAAGQRMTAYLRHLPMAEQKRHALVLQVLDQLVQEQVQDPLTAKARAMSILRDLVQEKKPILHVQPGPALLRQPMVPEEMDRRPWVGAFFKIWWPIKLTITNFSHLAYLNILNYSLLLTGLYALEKMIPWTFLFLWQHLQPLIATIKTS